MLSVQRIMVGSRKANVMTSNAPPFETDRGLKTPSRRDLVGVLVAAAAANSLFTGQAIASDVATKGIRSPTSGDGVSVTDFGAIADSDGTPSNGIDNFAAFTRAFDSGARTIFIPAAPIGRCYRLSAPWAISDSRHIHGEGAVPYDTARPSLGVRGAGSWLYFDHPGIGIDVENQRKAISGGIIRGIGTIRNQPAAQKGWSPAPNDFDLVMLGGDWFLDNICLWNPTNGINHNYAGFGRLRIGYIYGDPFTCGIRIDRCFDVFRIEGGVHFWPFAGLDPDHRAYKFKHLCGLDMRHCDEAFINDFFVGGACRGVVLSGGGDHQPPRDIQFGRLTIDLCGYAGIVVDASTPNGGSFSIDSFVTQGAITGDGNAAGAYAGVVIAADDFIAKIGNARYTRFNREMAVVTGRNSTLYQGPATIDEWNRSNINASAFAAPGDASKIFLTAPPTVLTRGGAIGDRSGRVQQANYSAL